MIRKVQRDEIKPFLKDASNFPSGMADEVIIPESVEEVASLMRLNREPIVVSGAGTGLTAGRIPLSGKVISMDRLNRIGDLNEGSIRIESGVRLIDLEKFLKATPWFYPPNPTEMLAFFGGTVATNASGSRSYKFGATRDYILEMDVVLPDGRKVALKRGHTIRSPLICSDGSVVVFPEVKYRSPLCKNAAGYFMQPGMDWIDLFIGSDGTLGIVTSIVLKVLLRPEKFLGGVVFLDREEACWDLVESIRLVKESEIAPCSLEYFDKFSLKRLRCKYPKIPKDSQAALFFEQDLKLKDQFELVFDRWYEFLDRQGVALEDSWFADSSNDLETFHQFRHAIPLLINEENNKFDRIKIGTDMAVEDKHFMEMMLFYRGS